MSELRAAAQKWTERALSFEVVDTKASIRERAEGFLAIAEFHGLTTEELVEWIHAPAPGKEWSAAEFRAYARKRAAERAAATAQPEEKS